jgi:hypothetical protein
MPIETLNTILRDNGEAPMRSRGKAAARIMELFQASQSADAGDA